MAVLVPALDEALFPVKDPVVQPDRWQFFAVEKDRLVILVLEPVGQVKASQFFQFQQRRQVAVLQPGIQPQIAQAGQRSEGLQRVNGRRRDSAADDDAFAELGHRFDPVQAFQFQAGADVQCRDGSIARKRRQIMKSRIGPQMQQRQTRNGDAPFD